MQKENYVVRYEDNKHKSIFYVERLDAKYEDVLYKELKVLAYGDGHFYLKKYGNSIAQIIFETADEYYVQEDFCIKHAKEISNLLTRVARQFGSVNSLKL